MNESFGEVFLKATKNVRFAAVAVLAFLALFLFLKSVDLLAYGIGRSDTYPTNTITVEGTGTGTAVPDMATISFSVTERGATVAEAQTKATEKTDAALSAVEGLSIEEKDIKTIAYNVYPQYEQIAPCYGGMCENRNPKIIGYEVSQTVEVKVRDTAKAGDVLQALGGLNVQNISGPNFTVDEADGVKSVARAEAIENAKEKAEALAKQLGVRLGKVVSFSENQGYYPMYDYGMYGKGGMDVMAEGANAPSLPTGETETSVTVMITYELK